MNKRKINSLLSLCQKAGFLLCGESICEKNINNAFLVLVAKDASNNTKKKFENKSFYYNAPCVLYGTKSELGQAIGKENRAVIVITEKNFAANLLKAMQSDV